VPLDCKRLVVVVEVVGLPVVLPVLLSLLVLVVASSQQLPSSMMDRSSDRHVVCEAQQPVF